MPDLNTTCRCQLVGGQWIRYSDDAGQTWSPRRQIPIRPSSIDAQNPWGGKTLQGWTVSKPVVQPSGAVLLPFTKIGIFAQNHDRTATSTAFLGPPLTNHSYSTRTRRGRGMRLAGCPATSTAFLGPPLTNHSYSTRTRRGRGMRLAGCPATSTAFLGPPLTNLSPPTCTKFIVFRELGHPLREHPHRARLCQGDLDHLASRRRRPKPRLRPDGRRRRRGRRAAEPGAGQSALYLPDGCRPSERVRFSGRRQELDFPAGAIHSRWRWHGVEESTWADHRAADLVGRLCDAVLFQRVAWVLARCQPHAQPLLSYCRADHCGG